MSASDKSSRRRPGRLAEVSRDDPRPIFMDKAEKRRDDLALATAREIVDADKRARAVKTARLREARLAKEAGADEGTPKRPAKR
jgi:hypothetical protein